MNRDPQGSSGDTSQPARASARVAAAGGGNAPKGRNATRGNRWLRATGAGPLARVTVRRSAVETCRTPWPAACCKARGPREEEAVEVVQNHEDGTRVRLAATLRRRAPQGERRDADSRGDAGRDRKVGPGVTDGGGAIFGQPAQTVSWRNPGDEEDGSAGRRSEDHEGLAPACDRRVARTDRRSSEASRVAQATLPRPGRAVVKPIPTTAIRVSALQCGRGGFRPGPRGEVGGERQRRCVGSPQGRPALRDASRPWRSAAIHIRRPARTRSSGVAERSSRGDA